MAKKTTKPTKQSHSEAVDMERLSQRQAAWLVDKPAVWFRDNPHRCGMNSDAKTYDARKLIESLRTDFKAATLSSGDINHICNRFEWIFYEVENRTLTLEKFQRIKEKHGAAGLATIGELLIHFLIQMIEFRGDGTREWSPKTDAEIRDQAMRDAEKSIKSSIECRDTQAARLRGDVVYICEQCESYRWGLDWHDSPLPEQFSGFAIEESDCPTCEKERLIGRV